MAQFKLTCETEGDYQFSIDTNPGGFPMNTDLSGDEPPGEYLVSWVVFGPAGTEYEVTCTGAKMSGKNPVKKKIPKKRSKAGDLRRITVI